MDFPPGYSDNNRVMGGLGSGIEVLISFLTMIIIITLTSYCITRIRIAALPPHYSSSPFTSNTSQGTVSTVVEVGLDEATLRGFPKLLYSKTKLRNGNSTVFCCSVCLADYKESDVLRMLPDCGHVFHLKCVDSWLRIHPSCPMCRNSPNGLTGPLAGEVPVPSRATV
ncbi:hypothetical protein FNV43_RR11661 [Rhamnella rubrinervis]|uniref:RING-type domain-containing protein n=1 Tax=Rhamnella rubrinervis TaxID=2594499 RepID=A0A8K0MHX8_9ROSA|nr:hypothetical protein FNV43_RR11661 [Rhamnella rubrinervis]